MKLEGTLGLFSLRELIEMSIYSSVVGVLNLSGQRGAGHIFFRDGAAYHSTYAGLAGEEALAALFEEQDASFAFVADVTVEESTIWGDIGDVMSRCEERAARWRDVWAALPTTALVPSMVSDPGAERLSIEMAHFAMLAGIDGERTLEEIADALNLDLLDVCEAAIRLRADGLVLLRPAAPRHSAPRAAAPASSASSPRSVIDRILATLPPVAAPDSPVDGRRSSPAPQVAAPAPLSAEEERILRLLRG